MHVQTLLAAAAAIITATMASPYSQRFSYPKRYNKPTIAERAADFDEENSPNYAGTYVEAADLDSGFITAIGTFVIPTCTAGDSSGGATSWEASFWPGIYDSSTGSGLIQAGVLCVVTTGAATTYSAWVEYIPAALIELPNFPVEPGDTVTIQIVRISDTSFEALFTDSTQGTMTSTTLSAPNAAATVTGEYAEWIVEALENGAGTLLPLANFDGIDWTSAAANDANNNVVGAVQEPFTVYTMEDSAGNDLTEFVDGSSGDNDAFTINYIGPGSSE